MPQDRKLGSEPYRATSPETGRSYPKPFISGSSRPGCSTNRLTITTPSERAATTGGRHGRTHELVTRSAMGAVGARGVGAPELDLLDVQRTGLPRCVVNVDGSLLVKRAGPLVVAHGDIYHEEIVTLVLLAAGLLSGGPERVRRRPLTPWDMP